MRFVESHKTLIKKLQHSYQESYDFISGVLRSLIRSLIISYQESYNLLTALLSRDHKTPIERLQHSTAKHSKNDRIFKFLSDMYPIRINFLPVLSNEKVLPSLKNDRRNL